LKPKNQLSHSFKIGDALEVSIEKIVPRGFGLAFAEGATVFVPLAAAGDRVRAIVSQVKGNILFAEIGEVLVPSPQRIEPPCKYFGTCGGCDFQQMNYDEQLAAKVGIIRDALHRIAKIEWGEIPIIASPKDFEYRSRAQWHANSSENRIGYYKRNSNDIVAIDSCPKVTPELNGVLTDIRNSIAWENTWSEKFHIEAASADNGETSIYAPEILEKTEDISFMAAGETFFYSAQCFFQGNHLLIEHLLDTALAGAEGVKAIDLYSGVGLFAIPMARKFGKVIAVEDNDISVDYAVKNAEYAGLTNIDLVRKSVDHAVFEIDANDIDLLLLDPPRSGASNKTMQRIIGLRAKAVSYVACDPSILARDLRKFVDAGYELDSITAIDLFPQTHHVETVARLHRVN
jgi:tRNA/tmRNA/rRNA uracil-C5-methylase (TrmA/RlmC/RlmD family)